MATRFLLLDDEVRPRVLVPDRHDLPQHAHRETLARVEVVLVVLEDFVRAPEKDRGEEEQHEGEAVHHRDAGRQEDRAEHQSADDAEEQHPVLIFPGHLEIGEDQREDEEVVDREALLQEPGRRVFRPRGRPQDEEDHTAEDEREAHPQHAPPGSFLEADDMRVSVGKQVDCEGDDHRYGERHPEPYRYIHARDLPS